MIDNSKAKAIIKKIKENTKCDASDMSAISCEVHYMVKDHKEKNKQRPPTASEKIMMHLRVTCGFISRKLNAMRQVVSQDQGNGVEN